jgi:4-hydroxy-tetrahydrodipicolinate reductase
MKKIVIFGICGKMGTSIAREVLKEKDLELIGGFDKFNIGEDIGNVLGTVKLGKKIYDSYDEIKKLNPDLIIDFTNAEIVYETINWAIDNGIDIIVGTTGLSKEKISNIEIKVQVAKSKVFIVPNFTIGAVIMMKIGGKIAKYFDNCEIIELHHDKKKDAPSGTSIYTAEQISKSKVFNSSRLKEDEIETIKASRGALSDGVHIHSIRLPGFLAHQEVIFGTVGQTLTVRHDSIDRSSFYPGILLAIKKIDGLGSFTYGLDKIIDL